MKPSGDILPSDPAGSRVLAQDVLDPQELQFFQLQQEGLTRAKIAATLGWPTVRVTNVAARVNYKLRQSGIVPHPAIAELPLKFGSMAISKYSFLERLPSGKRVWSLTPSFQTHSFDLHIVEAKIFKANPIFSGARMQTLAALNQDLIVEEARLGRMVAEREALQKKVKALARQVADAEDDLKKTEADSFRTGDWTTGESARKSARKQVSSLRDEYRLRSEELEIANIAIDGSENNPEDGQVAKVRGITSEISYRRNEAFLLETKQTRADIRLLLKKLATATQAYDNCRMKYGVDNNSAGLGLYPLNPADVYEGISYRQTALRAANSAQLLNLHSFEEEQVLKLVS